MRTIKFLIINMIILTLAFSCNSNKQKRLLTGNWYFFDKNMNYKELYINDSLITICNEMCMTFTYEYTLIGNILFIKIDDYISKKSFIRNTKDIFYMEFDSTFYEIRRNKDLKANFYDSAKSKDSYSKFLEGFWNRYQNKKNEVVGL